MYYKPTEVDHEQCIGCKYEKYFDTQEPCVHCRLAYTDRADLPCMYDAVLVNDTETVNHPAHYTRTGAMECIDEMLLLFGVDAVINFCMCNAWKYRYRAADKNGDEDIKKSDWYLQKCKELKNFSN